VPSLRPKGLDFVQAAIAKAAVGKGADPANYARARWGDDCRAAQFLKAAVGATESDDVLGSSGLAAAVEFMAAVRERSAVGQIMGLRRRPVDTRYLINTGTMAASWVGEGKSIPVLPLTFEQATLGLLKVASVGVFTDETLRSADPAVEAGVRQDMVDGLAQAIDTAFFDPDNAGSAGVSPASVTNGVTPVAVGTGTLDDTRDAISTMIAEFQGDLSRSAFVGRPELFAQLHQQGYRTVGIRGGELLGAPAIATKELPNDGSGFYRLLLIDPSGIAYVEDPAATQVTTSKDAAIQMDTAPTNDAVTPTPTNLVSLFQSNATAVKALAYANWSVEQTGAVSMMLAFPVAAVS
jgi:HK97 family phage major capsid protein